ncbi:Unknown protein [Striga hermonthica]|uniref:C2H2-type domain-containing protein n=1 Tax=Striga hermonthica TaxID=68872 RepID=A0A9N7N410_STRHE|nr:Unknown protein [Striga hermonthica]
MDYRYRLINQRAMEQDQGRIRRQLSTSLSRYAVPTSNFQDLEMAVLMEMEKEKIREEIIISEIARKRVLQAEVSREVGRWFPAMGGHFLLNELFQPARLSHLEERVMLMAESKKERHVRLGFEMPPFHGRTGGLRIPEVKPVCRDSSEGKKLIRLGKVDEKKSGSKRKSVSFPPQVSSGKKPKEDWSCYICNINCTGQRCLDDHLEGRKHKVKEAAKNAGKNFCIGFPKKSRAVDEDSNHSGAIVPQFLPPASADAGYEGKNRRPLLRVLGMRPGVCVYGSSSD